MDVQPILVRVLSDVLEKFAFMFTEMESGDDAYDESKQKYFQSTISYFGKNNGHICVGAPLDICMELSANILGLEYDEVNEQMATESLKELLNIICGEVIVELYGKTDIYDLQPPELALLAFSEWKKLCNNPNYIKVYVEEQPFIISCQEGN